MSKSWRPINICQMYCGPNRCTDIPNCLMRKTAERVVDAVLAALRETKDPERITMPCTVGLPQKGNYVKGVWVFIPDDEPPKTEGVEFEPAYYGTEPTPDQRMALGSRLGPYMYVRMAPETEEQKVRRVPMSKSWRPGGWKNPYIGKCEADMGIEQLFEAGAEAMYQPAYDKGIEEGRKAELAALRKECNGVCGSCVYAVSPGCNLLNAVLISAAEPEPDGTMVWDWSFIVPDDPPEPEPTPDAHHEAATLIQKMCHKHCDDLSDAAHAAAIELYNATLKQQEEK